MGEVKKILADHKLAKPISDHYHNDILIELCESFHIHLRNLRIALDYEEFERILRYFFNTSNAWHDDGKPKPSEMRRDRQIHYVKGKIKPIHGVENDALCVEELEDGHIHVHYRSLRLDLSKREFKEFADVIIRAYDKLEILDEDSNN